MLSLTALKMPTIWLLFEKVNVKCKTVPGISIKTVLKISNNKKFFNISLIILM